MNRRTCVSTCCGVAVLLVLAVRDGAAQQSDQDALQGSWRLETVNGVPVSARAEWAVLSDSWIQIGGSELRIAYPDDEAPESKPWQLTLLPEQSPKQFRASQSDKKVRGIYQFVDDSLQICVAKDQERLPADFKADDEAEQSVVTLRRMPAERAEAASAVQGDWRISSSSVPQLAGMRVTLRGELFRLHSHTGSEDTIGGFRLNPGQDPAQVDFPLPRDANPMFGPPNGQPLKGIYRLEDAKLQVCLPLRNNMPRPADVKPETDKGEILIVLERVTREWLANEMLAGARAARRLSEKKRMLKQTTEDFTGTEAAQQAGVDLGRLPPDEQIREIEAEDSLREILRKKAGHVQKEKMLQEHVTTWAGTKAAAEAEGLLPVKASREEVAAAKLRLAKKLMDRKSQTGKRWLQEIVDEFPETQSAAEAAKLLE